MLPPPLKIRVMVVVALTLAPEAARAACDTYSSETCHNVCIEVDDTLECDLTRNSGTAGGQISAVFADDGFCDDGSSKDYCAWGTDGAGNDFCCTFQHDSNDKTFVVLGTEAADLISLYYSCTSEYDLDDWGYGALFVGEVSARGGGDFITGSRAITATYKDKLHGDDGADDIAGQSGNDEISGDAGNDPNIDGGAGDDTLRGDGGSDVLLGGDGADTMNGGSGQDIMVGGTGNDIMNGDSDPDAICGDGNDDTLRGNGGEDLLWGGADTDNADGGTETDYCDAETVTCEASLGSRPLACP